MLFYIRGGGERPVVLLNKSRPLDACLCVKYIYMYIYIYIYTQSI